MHTCGDEKRIALMRFEGLVPVCDFLAFCECVCVFFLIPGGGFRGFVSRGARPPGEGIFQITK